MSDYNLITQFAEIENQIEKCQLLDAYEALSGLLSDVPSFEAQVLLQEVYDNYVRMLAYARQGVVDPKWHEIHATFCSQLYRVLDFVRYAFFAQDIRSLIYKALHHCEAFKHLKKTPIYYFYKALSAPLLSLEERSFYLDLMADDTVDEDVVPSVITGFLLASLYVFDPAKLELILQKVIPLHTNSAIRALVSAVLIIVKHEKRIERYPALQNSIQLLNEAAHIEDFIQTLQLQLLQVLQTQRDSQHVKDEIMPEMLKAAQKVMPDMAQFDISKLENFEDDLNPLWDNNEVASSMQDKVEELLELQKQGADTFFFTFSEVAHTQAFFSEAAHWLVPFRYANLHFENRDILARYSNMIFNFQPSCDTEKYSILLMLSKMPDAQLELMADKMGDFETKGLVLDQTKGEERDYLRKAMRFHLQDLFRFFTLFRDKDDRINPFKTPLNLVKNTYFNPYIVKTDSLITCADYAIKTQDWYAALNYLEQIDVKVLEATHYEKMGYCALKLNMYEEACVCFNRANIMAPESCWTLRQLGLSYILNGDYNAAISTLLQVEQIMPEDETTLLRLGECYMAVSDFAKAFDKFHKANYLNQNGKSIYALASCSMACKDFAKALHYYNKIITSSPEVDVYKNAAHAAWLTNDIELAVDYYIIDITNKGKNSLPSDYFEEADDMVLRNQKSLLELNFMRDIINDVLHNNRQ